MSTIYIPQQWGNEAAPDLHTYATKVSLLNYLHKGADGSVNLDQNNIHEVALPSANGDAANKAYVDERVSKSGDSMTGALDMGSNKITNLADPVAAGDAVCLRLLQEIKPMICITGEAVGALGANTSPFSFGGKSYKYATANDGNNTRSGVVIPSSGVIKHFTVCCTNSSGNAVTLTEGVAFTIKINDAANTGAPKRAFLSQDGRGIRMQYNPPLSVNAGDVINFMCVTALRYSFITIASVFIELNI